MTTPRPKFAKGVRLKAGAGGAAVLLVPEGALTLNASAAAALALVDGERTFDDIAHVLSEEFQVSPVNARADVEELFSRLRDRNFVTL